MLTVWIVAKIRQGLRGFPLALIDIVTGVGSKLSVTTPVMLLAPHTPESDLETEVTILISVVNFFGALHAKALWRTDTHSGRCSCSPSSVCYAKIWKASVNVKHQHHTLSFSHNMNGAVKGFWVFFAIGCHAVSFHTRQCGQGLVTGVHVWSSQNHPYQQHA